MQPNLQAPAGRSLRLLRRRRREHAGAQRQPDRPRAPSRIASANRRNSGRACIAGLSSASSALAALRTRENDDFTIGLLDAVACAADVLTFYQERIANESYLRTAIERVSLQEMAKLIGYRLARRRRRDVARIRARDAADAAARPAARPGRLRHRHPGRAHARRGPEGAQHARSRRKAADLRDGRSDRRARPSGTRCAAVTSVAAWSQRRDRGLAARRRHAPGARRLAALRRRRVRRQRDPERWDFRLLDAVEPDAANERTRVAWTAALGRVVAARRTRGRSRGATRCASARRCSATTRRVATA